MPNMIHNVVDRDACRCDESHILLVVNRVELFLEILDLQKESLPVCLKNNYSYVAG